MPETNRPYCKNEYIEYWIEDGILFAKYVKDVIIDLPAAIKVFELREEICKGTAFPGLADARGIKYWSKDSREFMNTAKNNRLLTAVAVVIDGLIQNIVTNFYIKVNKPSTPTRFFTSEKEALKWLQQFKNPK